MQGLAWGKPDEYDFGVENIAKNRKFEVCNMEECKSSVHSLCSYRLLVAHLSLQLGFNTTFVILAF